MGRFILAYDLGTGGNKASLYDIEGNCLSEIFVSYTTQYPKAGWHEQRPSDWWGAVVESTQILLKNTGIDRNEIDSLGISGHSLGVVPLDREGKLLRECTPIWSDSRSAKQTEQFFEKINEVEWYRLTGNGFPPALYSVFKIMWYRDNEPQMFDLISKVIGTKDFINYRLTGSIATDYSYASGSGIYDLVGWRYSDRLIKASELPDDIFPDILPSTTILGNLTKEAAEELSLPRQVKVVEGGVDNSCMALGARCVEDGRIYNSLGSSAWINVCSSKPLLDDHSRPYVFTHVMPGLYNSSVPVFSAGTCFRWVRDQLCKDLIQQAKDQGKDVYELMTSLASLSKVGSNGLLFNPSMAGGSSTDPSPNIRGAFIGLDLGHTQADIIRATMEGVAMEMRMSLDELRKLTKLSDEIVAVGGGSRSKLWRQIYASLYHINMVKTNIDQQAAALGAAALAAVGSGIWKDFKIIDQLHKIEDITKPNPEDREVYEKIFNIYLKAVKYLSEIGDDVAALHLNT